MLGVCETVTNVAYRTDWFPDASRVTVFCASLANIQQLTRQSMQKQKHSQQKHSEVESATPTRRSSAVRAPATSYDVQQDKPLLSPSPASGVERTHGSVASVQPLSLHHSCGQQPHTEESSCRHEATAAGTQAAAAAGIAYRTHDDAARLMTDATGAAASAASACRSIVSPSSRPVPACAAVPRLHSLSSGRALACAPVALRQPSHSLSREGHATNSVQHTGRAHAAAGVPQHTRGASTSAAGTVGRSAPAAASSSASDVLYVPRVPSPSLQLPVCVPPAASAVAVAVRVSSCVRVHRRDLSIGAEDRDEHGGTVTACPGEVSHGHDEEERKPLC